MDISIIPIGNSKGIRLPKTVLEKYNMVNMVELIMEKDHIILKAQAPVRAGWEKSFKKMHQNKEDILLMNDVFDDENFEEWS